MRSATTSSLFVIGAMLVCSCCWAQDSGPDARGRDEAPLPGHFFLGYAARIVFPYAADVDDPYGAGLGEHAEGGYYTGDSRLYLSVDYFTAKGNETSGYGGNGGFNNGKMRGWYLQGNWDLLFLKPHNFASPYLTFTAGLKAVRDQGTKVVFNGNDLEEVSWSRDARILAFGAGLGVDLRVASPLWITLNGRVIMEGRKDEGKMQHPDVCLGLGARIRI
jgi:hypothetical protein